MLEAELLKTITRPEEDARIGKRAVASDGCTGIITSISVFSDGYEVVIIKTSEITSHGGAMTEVTIQEEQSNEPK